MGVTARPRPRWLQPGRRLRGTVVAGGVCVAVVIGVASVAIGVVIVGAMLGARDGTIKFARCTLEGTSDVRRELIAMVLGTNEYLCSLP